MHTVLTVAGSDCSGGAGIQADLKTFIMHGVYGMSAITALTAQNTRGVRSIEEASPDFLADQLDAIFQDITPEAVKIGMVSSTELIQVIADKLATYKAAHIVVDPVMVATSGARLIEEKALRALKEALLPLAEVMTPNLPEAEILAEKTILSKKEMEEAAKALEERFRCGVLLKGGHRLEDADDLLVYQGNIRWFHHPRIANLNTHGTGCTLSSAIAAQLAKGKELPVAVEEAKVYVSAAIEASMDLGKGRGPIMHHVGLENPFS